LPQKSDSAVYRIAWIIILFALIVSACAPETPTPPITQQGERLVAAWVEAGNLLVWRQGEEMARRVASGGVIRPFVAPNGEHVAFTRGPGGLPQTLWVVDTNGTAERQLAGPGDPVTFGGDTQVGDVGWLDDSVLYFNTLRATGPAYLPKNDLYRANIRTREAALILPPGEGGRFHFSPDGRWVAVVYPGTYSRQDGRIGLVDPLGQQDTQDLLFFVGVASGAEQPFYPRVQWLPDSETLLAAVPDADLIYSDTGAVEDLPPTRLWRIPVGAPSDRVLQGTVQASFFGLPRWSDDGGHMLFVQRKPGTNVFTILLADGDGTNPVPYLEGEAGSVQIPR
jgi:hypothetical protein